MSPAVLPPRRPAQAVHVPAGGSLLKRAASSSTPPFKRSTSTAALGNFPFYKKCVKTSWSYSTSILYYMSKKSCAFVLYERQYIFLQHKTNKTSWTYSNLFNLFFIVI